MPAQAQQVKGFLGELSGNASDANCKAAVTDTLQALRTTPACCRSPRLHRDHHAHRRCQSRPERFNPEKTFIEAVEKEMEGVRARNPEGESLARRPPHLLGVG